MQELSGTGNCGQVVYYAAGGLVGAQALLPKNLTSNISSRILDVGNVFIERVSPRAKLVFKVTFILGITAFAAYKIYNCCSQSNYQTNPSHTKKPTPLLSDDPDLLPEARSLLKFFEENMDEDFRTIIRGSDQRTSSDEEKSKLESLKVSSPTLEATKSPDKNETRQFEVKKSVKITPENLELRGDLSKLSRNINERNRLTKLFDEIDDKLNNNPKDQAVLNECNEAKDACDAFLKQQGKKPIEWKLLPEAFKKLAVEQTSLLKKALRLDSNDTSTEDDLLRLAKQRINDINNPKELENIFPTKVSSTERG